MPDVRTEEARPGRVYPWYVLAVLVLVYVLNFVDRQIVVILAERIKADLKVTDAQLGFLMAPSSPSSSRSSRSRSAASRTPGTGGASSRGARRSGA